MMEAESIKGLQSYRRTQNRKGIFPRHGLFIPKSSYGVGTAACTGVELDPVVEPAMAAIV
jgi:hypothetical protein